MALLFKGIYDQMVTAGYQVLVMNSNNDQELERQEIHQLLSKQIDGLIIQPSAADFAAYQMVVDNHIPFVTIDRPIANQPTSVPHVASNIRARRTPRWLPSRGRPTQPSLSLINGATRK